MDCCNNDLKNPAPTVNPSTQIQSTNDKILLNEKRNDECHHHQHPNQYRHHHHHYEHNYQQQIPNYNEQIKDIKSENYLDAIMNSLPVQFMQQFKATTTGNTATPTTSSDRSLVMNALRFKYLSSNDKFNNIKIPRSNNQFPSSSSLKYHNDYNNTTENVVCNCMKNCCVVSSKQNEENYKLNKNEKNATSTSDTEILIDQINILGDQMLLYQRIQGEENRKNSS